MIGIIPRRGLSQIIACLGGSELTLEYVCVSVRPLHMPQVLT